MKQLKITLLGSIPKGDAVRTDWTDWKTEYIAKLRQAFPQAADFLNGDQISDKEGDELIVGHDLWLIKHGDIIIVDAKKKIGAGTAQEIVIAKYFHKPVITIIPKDTHHRKSNITFHGTTIEDWIHPFLALSSDYVAESIEDAIEWIKSYLENPKQEIKDITLFDEAIEAFETKMLKSYNEYKKKGW
jgi:hypothetical protein